MSDDIDLKKLMKEYDSDFDFGFTAVSEEEYNKAISESIETVETYKARLIEVEKLILPFLMKLLKTADNPHIHWPNRGPQIQKQIEKIVKLTRGK